MIADCFLEFGMKPFPGDAQKMNRRKCQGEIPNLAIVHGNTVYIQYRRQAGIRTESFSQRR